MLDKDKLIIIIFIPTEGLTRQQAEQKVLNIIESYKGCFDESVKIMYFTDNCVNYRVEFHYPNRDISEIITGDLINDPEFKRFIRSKKLESI